MYLRQCNHELQSLSYVPPNYMAQQSDINEKMRGVLVDWLIEVGESLFHNVVISSLYDISVMQEYMHTDTMRCMNV